MNFILRSRPEGNYLSRYIYHNNDITNQTLTRPNNIPAPISERLQSLTGSVKLMNHTVATQLGRERLQLQIIFDRAT